MNKIEFKELMDQINRINYQFTAVKRSQSFTKENVIHHPAEMNVLTHLSDNPRITVSDLAASLFISKSAASQLIKKLAAKGLIEKRRNLMNERIVNLSLTGSGRELVESYKAAESASLGEFFETFSDINEDDMRIARGFLYKLEKVLKTKVD